MGACKKTCQCGGLNLGVKSTAEFGVARQIGFMPYINSSGDINSLDLTVDWDKTFWDDLISQLKYADRLQLLDIDEYNPTTSDSTKVERPSGVSIKTRDGVTSYEIWVDDADGTLYDNLKSLECPRMGFILVDDCGAVAGKECETGKLNVAEIAKKSFDVVFFPATDADISRVRVQFNLDATESPVYDVVPSSEIEYSPKNLDSICDVEPGVPSIATTTQLVIELEAANSFSKTKVLAEGMDTPATWTITDSVGAISNPTTVTEAPAGTYTLDYVAIAAGDTNFKYVDTNYEANFNVTVV